jgi:hypothetical protein
LFYKRAKKNVNLEEEKRENNLKERRFQELQRKRRTSASIM